MLVSFFQDDNFMESYEVSFSYRYSYAYDVGFRNRVQRKFDTFPLKLLDMSDIYSYVNKIPFRPMRKLVKLVFNLFLIKYLFILLNTYILFKVFRRKRIDLLHINNGGYPGAYSCMSAVFAAKLSGIYHIVYVVNNIATSYKSPLRWLDFPLDLLVSKFVSYFVTGSKFAAIRLKKVLNLTANKYGNIYNGVSQRVLTESKQEILQRLGINSNRVLLGVIAILEERKGHIYLLKAIKLLKEQGYVKSLPLLIIEGSGTQLENIQKFVVDCELTNDVLFIGRELNVFNLMNALDVIILPSINYEDFPNVVIESMGLGKPVIASELAGIPEQIDHMKSGIIVKPKDVNGIAEAIKQIIDKPELSNIFGDNGLIKFNEEFTSVVSVNKYVDLYARVLKSQP